MASEKQEPIKNSSVEYDIFWSIGSIWISVLKFIDGINFVGHKNKDLQGLNYSTEPELKELINDKRQLFVDLINQITKDFRLCGFDIELDVQKMVNFNQLKNALIPIIESFIPNQVEDLANVCYRIDIQEQLVNDIFSSPTVNNTAEKITELLLVREMKKVILRHQLKS